MDIVVCTTADVLAHKRSTNFRSYYWKFAVFPKDFLRGDKIYFVTNGWVRGSFQVNFIDLKGLKVAWRRDTWEELKKKFRSKHFQGFKYRWWK